MKEGVGSVSFQIAVVEGDSLTDMCSPWPIGWPVTASQTLAGRGSGRCAGPPLFRMHDEQAGIAANNVLEVGIIAVDFGSVQDRRQQLPRGVGDAEKRLTAALFEASRQCAVPWANPIRSPSRTANAGPNGCRTVEGKMPAARACERRGKRARRDLDPGGQSRAEKLQSRNRSASTPVPRKCRGG